MKIDLFIKHSGLPYLQGPYILQMINEVVFHLMKTLADTPADLVVGCRRTFV